MYDVPLQFKCPVLLEYVSSPEKRRQGGCVIYVFPTSMADGE